MKKALRTLPYDILRINASDLTTAYLLQSSAWARVKSQFGWEAIAFRQSRYTCLHQDVLVLLQKIKAFGYLMYVPDGLLVRDALANYTADTYQRARENAFDILFDIAHLISVGYTKRIFCVRWDAPWCVENKQDQEYFPPFSLHTQHRALYTCTKGKVYTGAYVQPPATVILDLRKGEETLLRTMKSKTRYNIRLAKKKGVRICDKVSLNSFYDLYKITSQRNGIAIHSKTYYAAVLDALRKNKYTDLRIYGAYYEDELIASGIISYYTAPTHSEGTPYKNACYLYGASSNEHRNLMPMYSLQWHAICEAQHNDCTHYDLFGIPLTDNAKSSMQGLYRFKTGFGGAIYVRGGGFACVPGKHYAEIKYTLFQCAERVYTRIMKIHAARKAMKNAHHTS